MDSFPAFFPLAGRTVVIAGTGEAAEAKARLLAGSPATVVRLEGDAALDAAAYAGAILAFVGAEDEAFATAAAAAARAAHVPVNVVDRPALCDFTTPAVIDRGAVVAAVGTGGGSPMLAALLRQDIEARVPEGAGRVAVMFRTLQAEVRAAIPEPHRRRAFLRGALTGPAAQAAMAGDMPEALALLRAEIANPQPGMGRVSFLDASGPSDRLTLKATRALAGADLVVVDEGVDVEVLALTRRDVARHAAAELTADLIAKATAEGLRIVRLAKGPPDADEMLALAEVGVETEVLPVVAP